MRSFWLVLPKLIFWKGDLTLGYVSIQTFDFFTFPNFLSLKSFENSWGNLYSRIFILAIKLLIYCEKCEQDCLKKYILLSTSSAMVQVSGKNSILAQKRSFNGKITYTIAKVESFPKFFDLNQTCEVLLTLNR